MASKLTALTESVIFGDSDQFYTVIDPGGSPLSRRIQSLTFQRYLPMPQEGITGLTLSNNGADATNDLDIAAGRAGAGTGNYNLILTAAKTKQLDAVWAVGTNQGGLDTGVKAVSTWYHIWLIARVDTHVVDMLFSTSVSAPTMPANYTMKRRIGAIRTDAAGVIIPFLQYGDDFWWKSPPFLDIDDATLTTSKKDYTLAGVPAGIVAKVYGNMRLSHGTAAIVYLSNPNFTDLAPSATVTPMASGATVGANVTNAQVRLITDTSAKISARSSASSTTIRITVLGWTDPRGKQ